MKRYLLGIYSACFLFAACSKSPVQPVKKDTSPVMNIAISPQVSENTSNFAFRFFRALLQTQPDTGNIFVSPLSLHVDLGMLLNGANGETYTQLQNALDLNGLSIDEINKAYQTLLQDLPDADKQVQLALANSMWYKNTFSVEADYSATLKNYFLSAAYPSAFGKPAVDSINQWASDNTNGKINDIMDNIDPGEVMFLLNALYFKGDWTVQFDKKNTKPQPFRLENGSTKQVQMMSKTDTVLYAGNSAYSAVQLPYGNGQFSMTVILPNDGNKLEDVINNFAATDWTGLHSSAFVKREVNIGLPRFTIPLYNVNLIPVLQKMGVTDVFSDRLANLSKINPIGVNGALYVNLLKQFTYLNVDEIGTEAAAVTVIGITTTAAPAPPPFICDHPFGIIISENTSNTILFMGRIVNPQSE